MSTGLVAPPPMIVRPPTGTSSLPIVELDRHAVVTDRKQIRLRSGSKKRQLADCSFGSFQDHLSVDAWAFFHAAKKTELTTSFTTADVDSRALCFGTEYSSFFKWNTNNLRRVDRSVFSLEDFAEAGLAGRFGEAIAYLTMVKKGYIYWDRIATLWERAANHSGMTHLERVQNAQVIASKIGAGRPDLEPDFAFEDSVRSVALMESKGSFVHPANDNPTTKNDLRHALNQLTAWTGMVTPTPAKSFAIGTYFRDESDTTGDPSLIAYVDPPGQADGQVTPAEFPADWIRRGNYGAWLIGMGLSESGEALRRGVETRLPPRPFAVAQVGTTDFVVAIGGFRLKDHQRMREFFRMPWIYPWLPFEEIGSRHWELYLRHLGVAAVRVIGIDVPTMRLIERSVRNSADAALLERERQETPPPETRAIKDFYGSILPDGTILGEITLNSLTKIRMESFQL